MKTRDNVIGIVDEEHWGCKVKVGEKEDRFGCSECGEPVQQLIYGNHMYVDSQGMIWCSQCGYRARQGNQRSVAKNPDDDCPKIYDEKRNYYWRLIRKSV